MAIPVERSLASPTYKNPDSTLDSDDFLKLFLTQLKNQDPTKPMDSSQMLEQTSQLTVMQTQVEQQKAFEEITKTLKSSATYQSQFALVSSIGKIAVTKNDGISLSKDTPNPKFQIYLKEPIKGGEIKVYDSTGQVVRKISLTDYKNSSGLIGKDENGANFKTTSGQFKFLWDGKDNSGKVAAPGTYRVEANLISSDNKRFTSKLGTYPIESVKFDKGKAYLKVGGNFIPFTDISEIKQ
jgi:flagellar basal-body rod modification protein FlgD